MAKNDPVLMAVRIAKAKRDEVKIAAIRLGTTMEAIVNAAVDKELAELRPRLREAATS